MPEEKKKRGYSAAQGRATQKWQANNYYRVNVSFPISEKDFIKAAAEKNNMSVSALIQKAVYEYINK